MKLLITGATGYIGARLAVHAHMLGHDIISASRRPLGQQYAWLPFELSVGSEIRIPPGTDAVFHLAANTVPQSDEEIEVNAAINLLNATKQRGAKFVFVSSQTAREDAPTSYGRIKWRIERAVLSAGGWVVRPGQVYGGQEEGLFGFLVRYLKNSPIIPAFLPSPLIQPVHIDDLVRGLLKILDLKDISPSILYLGMDEPITFTFFLQAIAKYRLKKCRLFIPIPVPLMRFCIIYFGSYIHPRFGLDRLMSLFELPLMHTSSTLQLLGLSLRPLSDGLTC